MPPPSALRQTFAVVISALRLLWRHWPTLLVLALAGLIAREELTVLSASASEIQKVVGLLVFALVPLSMLTALILMMRTVRASLPDPPTAAGEPDAKRSVWAHFASVLVPFLAVYASWNYFKYDEANYRTEILVQEVFANADSVNASEKVDVVSRLPNQIDTTLLFVIGSAILLRMLLGRIAKNNDHAALGFGRGYLEATWIALTAASVDPLLEKVRTWTFDRKFVVWLTDLIDGFASLFGPLSGLVKGVFAWFGEILGSLDALVVVPIAWLTIGCVVYGHQLVSPSTPGGDPEELETVRRGIARLPAAARKALHPLRNDTRDRFGPMVRGFRVLRQAGLPTMLLFCVAFVTAQAVPEWLWELERTILGPQDLVNFWIPVSGPLSIVNSAIGIMLIICLVAAAVDHVLRLPRPGSESAAVPSPTSGDPQADEVGIQRLPTDPDGNGFGIAGGDEEKRGAIVG